MVKPGDTFLAYVGEKVDARKFIPQAIEAGANAVLWERNGFVWNFKMGATHLIYRYQNCALRLAQSLVMYMEIRQENYG